MMSNQQGSFQPGFAVSTVFEQVKPLEEQLDQIKFILEPMHQLSELAKVFEPLRDFEAQIKELAKVLEPMRDFQAQLRQVLKQFTPLQTLDQELRSAFGIIRRKFEPTRLGARTGGHASGSAHGSRYCIWAGQDSSPGILGAGAEFRSKLTGSNPVTLEEAEN
jgi:regulator of replication initiation timing